MAAPSIEAAASAAPATPVADAPDPFELLGPGDETSPGTPRPSVTETKPAIVPPRASPAPAAAKPEPAKAAPAIAPPRASPAPAVTPKPAAEATSASAPSPAPAGPPLLTPATKAEPAPKPVTDAAPPRASPSRPAPERIARPAPPPRASPTKPSLAEQLFDAEPDKTPAAPQKARAAPPRAKEEEEFLPPPAKSRLPLVLGIGAVLLLAIGGAVVALSGPSSQQAKGVSPKEAALRTALQKIDEQMMAGRYTGPGGDSALDQLRAAIAAAPDDARVKERQAKLVRLFDERATDALAKGDQAEAAVQLIALSLADPSRDDVKQRLADAERKVKQQSPK